MYSIWDFRFFSEWLLKIINRHQNYFLEYQAVPGNRVIQLVYSPTSRPRTWWNRLLVLFAGNIITNWFLIWFLVLPLDLSSDKAWGIQGQVTTIRGQLTSQVPHHQRRHTSLPHTSPQDPDWKSLAENILNKVVTCSNPSVKKEIHLNICKLPLLH